MCLYGFISNGKGISDCKVVSQIKVLLLRQCIWYNVSSLIKQIRQWNFQIKIKLITVSKLSIHSFIQVFINMFIYTYFYIHFNIKDFENNNCYIYCNMYCINNVKYYIFINHFASKGQRKNRNIQKNAFKDRKIIVMSGSLWCQRKHFIKFFAALLNSSKRNIFSPHSNKGNAPEKMAAKMLTLPPPLPWTIKYDQMQSI